MPPSMMTKNVLRAVALETYASKHYACGGPSSLEAAFHFILPAFLLAFPFIFPAFLFQAAVTWSSALSEVVRVILGAALRLHRYAVRGSLVYAFACL